MKKKEIEKEIKEVVAKIKSNSKDEKFASKLVRELLSKKSQLDLEPALVHVPITGKEETIDTGGAFKMYRNKEAVVFHSNGFDFVYGKKGYDVVIKNYLKTAHCPYDALFDLWKKRNEGTLNDEEKEMYDALLLCGVNLMQCLNIACTSEQRQVQLAFLVENWLEEINDEIDLATADLTETDFE